MLLWPGKLSDYLDVSLFVDQNVLGTHISNDFSSTLEKSLGFDKTVEQIEEFLFVEGSFDLSSVGNFWV